MTSAHPDEGIHATADNQTDGAPSKSIEPFTQNWIVLPDCFISHRHATAVDDPARPPRAHLVFVHKMRDRLPLCEVLSKQIFQGSITEHRMRKQTFQPGVLVFQPFEPFSFADVLYPEFGFPLVDRGIADAMRSAKISDRYTGLVLLENDNDLFFGEPVALHLWSFRLGQSLTQTGLAHRGNVKWLHKPFDGETSQMEENFTAQPHRLPRRGLRQFGVLRE